METKRGLFSNLTYMKSNGIAEWIVMVIIIVTIVIRHIHDQQTQEEPVVCKGAS